MRVPQVVTVGEAMGALRSAAPLRLGGPMHLSVAGAEATVAIGLARLGHAARWVGRVGADELGELVLRTLRAENVDVGNAGIDADGRPTGLLLFEARVGDLVRTNYYRAGSAGSAVSAADVLAAIEPGIRVLHVTGITPALGPAAADAIRAGVARARDVGATVCLDVNYRAKLWSADDARAVLAPLARSADVLFASEDELPLVSADPTGGERDSVRALLAAGPREVVLTRGAGGATVVTAEVSVSAPARRVPVLDVVGAGDAFVAGYLSGLLDGLDVRDRLHRAGTTAAFGVATRGDWEGLPTRAELALLDGPAGATIR